MLALSFEDSARVSLRSRRVLPFATIGPRACAEVDAFAATSGFAESSENAVAKAWSSDVGKLAFAAFSPSSSPSLSTTIMISFAGFFFALGLVFRASRSGPVALKRILQHVHQFIRA